MHGAPTTLNCNFRRTPKHDMYTCFVLREQEIESLTGTEADDGEEDISMMVLPDYSSGNNEKDIHVKNFNINVGGLELLDCADLKLAYGRKVCTVVCAFCVRLCCGILLENGPIEATLLFVGKETCGVATCC